MFRFQFFVVMFLLVSCQDPSAPIEGAVDTGGSVEGIVIFVAGSSIHVTQNRSAMTDDTAISLIASAERVLQLEEGHEYTIWVGGDKSGSRGLLPDSCLWGQHSWGPPKLDISNCLHWIPPLTWKNCTKTVVTAKCIYGDATIIREEHVF